MGQVLDAVGVTRQGRTRLRGQPLQRDRDPTIGGGRIRLRVVVVARARLHRDDRAGGFALLELLHADVGVPEPLEDVLEDAGRELGLGLEMLEELLAGKLLQGGVGRGGDRCAPGAVVDDAHLTEDLPLAEAGQDDLSVSRRPADLDAAVLDHVGGLSDVAFLDDRLAPLYLQ